MAKIRTGELDVHVQRLRPAGTADAPIVVLVHGLLIDSLASYYLTLGPRLAAEGMDVIMYDLRGHGKTTRPTSGYQLERFTEDLDLLLDALDVDRPVHLIGNSFGGAIAYAFAAAHPDRVASLTAIECGPPNESWRDHMAFGLAEAVPYLSTDEEMAKIVHKHGAHLARLFRSASKSLKATTIGTDIGESKFIADDLSEIRCPVFAFFSDETGLATLIPELEAKLTDFRSVVVPDQGHFILVEQPRATADLIVDWLHTQIESTKHEADLLEAM